MRYRIKDLAPGLDGLVIEGNEAPSGYVFVEKLSNESIIVGDRNVSVPVIREGLAIRRDCLQKIDDKQREYAHDNPFGNALFSGEIKRDQLTANYVQYERGLGVTIRETIHEDGKYNDVNGRDIARTLYSQNFFGDKTYLSDIKEIIEDAFSCEETESADDLIFQLREIKETER